MKVIFLDIDGVLNSHETLPASEKGGMLGIHAVLASRFVALLARTGAHWVLSSTWRQSEHWRATMRANGLPMDLCEGRTPVHRGHIRGEEIDEWLRLHPAVESYAIIDDDRDMLPHQPHFRTSLFEGGLTHDVCMRVEQHFLV